MAHHSATLKSIRQNVKRTERNKTRISRVRTFVKQVETAITSGKKDAANEALRTAESEIMKAVSKGIIKKETAARKVSRLSARVKAIAAK